MNARWIFLIFATLFGLKIMWNLTVPYALVVRSIREQDPRRGISLMPGLELAILGIAVLVSALADLDWPWSTAKIALVGLAAITGSYVHLFLASAVMQSIRKRT